MSIWKGLKSAFGFGSESEEYDEEYDSSLPTYAAVPRPKVASQPAVTVAPAVTTQEPAATVAPETNAVQSGNTPDFTDVQRDYIIRVLTRSLQRNASEESGASSGEVPSGEECEALRQRIATLEANLKDTDELRQENRKLRLSVERQKRALLDRINDLEAQAAKHNAEKEKFFSEKRHNNSTPADNSALEAANTRIKELEETIAERDKSIAEREEEIKRQSTLREQLEVKTEMSDRMINELRNQAAAERHEYEDTCRQQQAALEQINEQVQSFEQIRERMENRIKELKEALRAEKARDLDSQVTELNDRIGKLTEENASLRHTIENNLYNQATSESKLRDEIKELHRQLEAAKSAEAYSPRSEASAEDPEILAEGSETYGHRSEASAEGSNGKRRRGRPKKVKLDDELDNTDWFSSHKDDPDFGYHEPPRRPANDNAAQLSLF